VILTVPTEPQRVGSPIMINISVKNISSQPLWMIGVLDGSEIGFRYPHYKPSITGSVPIPPPENLPWCGNVAPLRLQDFHYLLPGESFDPIVPQEGAEYLPLVIFNSFRPSLPGNYEFRLEVSTESEQEEDWLGVLEYPGKENVLARLAKVPRLQIESKVTSVKVI
jgi:hypothetical protein